MDLEQFHNSPLLELILGTPKNHTPWGCTSSGTRAHCVYRIHFRHRSHAVGSAQQQPAAAHAHPVAGPVPVGVQLRLGLERVRGALPPQLRLKDAATFSLSLSHEKKERKERRRIKKQQNTHTHTYI